MHQLEITPLKRLLDGTDVGQPAANLSVILVLLLDSISAWLFRSAPLRHSTVPCGREHDAGEGCVPVLPTFLALASPRVFGQLVTNATRKGDLL